MVVTNVNASNAWLPSTMSTFTEKKNAQSLLMSTNVV